MSEQLVNLPETFQDWDSALTHLESCCELLGVKVSIGDYLPVKSKIYCYCKALNIDHLDIYERVARDRDER